LLTGILALVAATNHLADPPLFPDGSVDPSGTITVLQNDGSGNFTQTASIPTLQFPSQALWANIFNSGNPDLVVLDNLNQHVAVYQANGAGTFNPIPQEFPLGGAAAQIAIVKLVSTNAWDDVVLTVPATNEIMTLFNNGLGTLTASPTIVVGTPGRFVANDMTGDTFLDLAVVMGSADTVGTFIGDGSGSFTAGATFIPPFEPIMIVGGEFLGVPGQTDLAVLSRTAEQESDSLSTYANIGSGNFSLSSSLIVPNLAGNLFVLGNVGGGGVDLAVTHTNSRYISYLRNDGIGNFSNSLPETTRNPIEATWGSVSTNVGPDIVTVEGDKRAIGIFAGDGAGGLSRTQIGLLTKPTFPRIVDVDNAGKDDLLVLEPNSDRLAVFLNVNP
jgi:hypothetical protein